MSDSAPPRLTLRCHECHSASPEVEGDTAQAQSYMTALGWLVRHDGRALCPLCNDRSSTTPPPPNCMEAR